MTDDAVDLFAGWGGFTLAAKRAGVRVVAAANHWPLAVRAHELNHPETLHICQDLRQADWSALPPFGMLLASPACQGHSSASRARRRAYHDAMRATAWAVVDCAEVTRPKALIVENVLSFRDWNLYPLWKAALRALGYHVVELVMTASRHGVPQRRTRLFVVGTRVPATKALIELHDAARRLTVEPAFGPCIDWDCGDWRPRKDALPGAQARMRAAVDRLGPRCLSQHVTGHRGVALDEPLRTVTGQDHWVVVDGDRYRPLTIRENARAMSFPDDYAWPESASRSDSILGLGNAVPPLLAEPLIRRVAEVAA